MSVINASRARKELFRLLDEVAEEHKPVTITGPRHNGVLIGEEDWRSIEETLFLLSIPGMRASLRKGMSMSHTKMSKEPGW